MFSIQEHEHYHSCSCQICAAAAMTTPAQASSSPIAPKNSSGRTSRGRDVPAPSRNSYGIPGAGIIETRPFKETRTIDKIVADLRKFRKRDYGGGQHPLRRRYAAKTYTPTVLALALAPAWSKALHTTDFRAIVIE